MLRLVWPFHRHAEIVGLLLGKLGQFHADAVEVQASDVFIQMLRQAIHANLVCLLVLPQVQLREALVGSPREITPSASHGVNEAAFGEQINRAAIGQHGFVRTAIGHLKVRLGWCAAATAQLVLQPCAPKTCLRTGLKPTFDHEVRCSCARPRITCHRSLCPCLASTRFPPAIGWSTDRKCGPARVCFEIHPNSRQDSGRLAARYFVVGGRCRSRFSQHKCLRRFQRLADTVCRGGCSAALQS